MSLRINQNVMSIRTYGQLDQTAGRLEKSIEKLSSGLRINRAADDAAGLAISEKLRRQVRGLSRAILNAQDGVSMIQTAEGSLGESQSNLQRMRELAIQAANDTLTSGDRLEIQKEVLQLRDDLNRIANNTDFNTKRLLDGSQAATISSTSFATKGIVTGESVSGDFEISLTMVTAGLSQRLRSQVMTNKENGDLAQASTTLLSISQFYDSNGAFALDTAKTLTVVGNSRTAGVVVNGGMTLGQLSNAIYSVVRAANGLGMNNTTVDFVTTASSGVSGVGGYIDITSGIVGLKGEISLAGDQQFINALGVANVREATDMVIQATSRDVTGNTVRINTNDGRAVGLLQGADLKFEAQGAQVGGLGGIVKGLKFSANGGGGLVITVADIGWAGNNVVFTIASGSWTMDGLARYFNTTIDNAWSNSGFTAKVVSGEIQFQYAPQQASLSDGFTFNSSIEALGISNKTYYGNVTGKKLQDTSHRATGFSLYNANATAAAVAVNFTISIGTSEVSWQAFTASNSVTVADMVEFATFRNDFLSASDLVATFSSSVDMFQIGSTVAFSSIAIGQQNKSDGSKVTSRLTLQITAGGAVTSADAVGARDVFKFWSNLTDQSSGKLVGVGDRNFRFHVVAQTPQFHIGADQGQSMGVPMGNMSSEALGVEDLNMTTVKGANVALSKINLALDKVTSERSKLGSYQNRLEYAISNLRNMHTNMVSAESRIRDVDVAMEMIEFTRNQIVNQAGTAMLAQANLVPQGVLSLLK